MRPQPSSLPPLPPALNNSNPSPSFAEFAFSPNFGRPPSLQERLGYGPRIVPFKFHKPLPASNCTESETAAASEAMDIDHPIREDIAPETLPQTNSSLHAGPSRPLEVATGPSPLPRKPPPDDIWTYAAKVQNEWASVERPPLSVMTHIPKTSDDRGVSTTGFQILQGISAAFGTEQSSNSLPPTRGMSQQMGQHSEHTHHVSQSHTPERIKEEEIAVEVKQEDLPPSLPALSPSLHSQVKTAGSLDSESETQFVKKEESPIQSTRDNSQESQPSSVVFNTADMHPTIVNGPTHGLTDGRHQSRILNESHNILHLKPGVATSSHLYSRTSRTSPPSQEFHAEEPKTQSAETQPPATRNIANPMPYYSPQNTAPFLDTNAPLRSTSPSQIANQRGDAPQRHYQGRTHREPASAHVSQPTRSPGYTSYNPRTTVGSAFSSPNSTSDDRGRNFRRELASLPVRPAEGYHSYSPRRANSPSRYPVRYRETSPRVKSPHTPPYPSPRQYLRRPSPRSRSRSRSPVRRVETFAPHRNEYPVDHRARPRQSRSRSPRRRWSERGPPRVPSPPRVPQYNFTRRYSAESYHERIVNHDWSFPAERRPMLSPHRSPRRIIVGADCYRPNREGRDPPVTSSNSGAQNLDFLHRTPSPESANDADGPMHHGGVAIEVPEVAYFQRDSSVEHSPVAMQPDTIQQEEDLSHTDRTRRAMSDHAMSPRYYSSTEPIAEPIPNASLRPGKRYRDESESQSEAMEQELAADAEPGTKRRKLNAEDTDMLDVVANTRDPIGGKQDDAPPATASSTVGPIGLSVTEEYTLAPHSKLSIVQNKLWRRMAGNPSGSGTPQPGSLPQTLPSDPDEAFGIQERQNAQASSVVSLEDTPMTSRISLKARLHGSRLQNNYVATRPNSPPPSSFETVDPSGLLLNRVSSLKLTPPLQVGDPLEAQPSPLIGRIGFRPASGSPINGAGEVAELSALRPAPKSRVPSLNDCDGSTLLARVAIVNEQSASHLLSRVGLSADQVPPQRPRQGSKGGRGAASRTYLGGNLADRLG